MSLLVPMVLFFQFGYDTDAPVPFANTDQSVIIRPVPINQLIENNIDSIAKYKHNVRADLAASDFYLGRIRK